MSKMADKLICECGEVASYDSVDGDNPPDTIRVVCDNGTICGDCSQFECRECHDKASKIEYADGLYDDGFCGVCNQLACDAAMSALAGVNANAATDAAQY